ncbi:UNVERIFIED_CONTAM: hypothetical protein Slati_1412800 [Sesamum latifolium]|uniref:Reverse transcriptase domain-containing protein n=1 Tax=Sesamum latifolium TaxID=2727402 RepID=A0AAW2X367_9LAMI
MPEVLVLTRRRKETKQGKSEHPALSDPPEKEPGRRQGARGRIMTSPQGSHTHDSRRTLRRRFSSGTKITSPGGPPNIYKRSLDVEIMEDTPLIQFGRAERSGPQTIHNDALVITAVLANYEFECIFIDSGSSADILFGEAYDQMQLGDVFLKKVNTLLYEFAGEVVPRGMVSLPLTMGRGTARKTCLLKFLVVDVPSAYNVILDRPTLNTFQAVISTYNMKIKFPTPGGVGEVQGDPLQFRRCYVDAVCKGQKRNGDDAPDGAPPGKKGKPPEGENSEEIEIPAKVQPAEELLNIEIIPGNPDKTTRIGSHLGEEAKKEIT